MFLFGGGLQRHTTRAVGKTVDLTAIDAIAGGGYDCEPHRRQAAALSPSEPQMDRQKPAPPGALPSEPDVKAAGGRQAGTNSINRHISRQLRAIYDEVVNEPIPDRLASLLEGLDRRRVDP